MEIEKYFENILTNHLRWKLIRLWKENGNEIMHKDNKWNEIMHKDSKLNEIMHKNNE